MKSLGGPAGQETQCKRNCFDPVEETGDVHLGMGCGGVGSVGPTFGSPAVLTPRWFIAFGPCLLHKGTNEQ